MWLWIPGLALLAVALYDVLQKRRAILRNFPLIGHFRYLLESIGPELRQYIVTDNVSERPFSRDQRRWVYASSKKENNTFGFGTDNDLERAANYVIIKHRVMGAGQGAAGEAYGKAGADETYRLPVRLGLVYLVFAHGWQSGAKNEFRILEGVFPPQICTRAPGSPTGFVPGTL